MQRLSEKAASCFRRRFAIQQKVEMTKFEKIYQRSSVILTEAAIVERLKEEYHLQMDPQINHAGMIYTHPENLELFYRQYITIAQKQNLPIMLMTPTRKVNAASIQSTPFQEKNLISDACTFLNKISESYGDFSSNILTGGLLGCKGDAYTSGEALGTDEAYAFHRQQTSLFEREKVDFLFAGIMPEVNEALGMARAMAETGIPYIISFMIRNNGCLIDGTPICKAIEFIDQNVQQQPVCYMTNCVHPTNLRLALTSNENQNHPSLTRFQGIQANASILSPEELNNCETLKKDDFNVLIEEMLWLHHQYGLKILGGCCGTNDLFLDRLSNKINSTAAHLSLNKK